jgi:hypothetical protein
MTLCRSAEEVRAAALADAKDDEPLTQDQADLVAAIRAPHIASKGAAA